jgi:hypothetical protein
MIEEIDEKDKGGIYIYNYITFILLEGVYNHHFTPVILVTVENL